MKLGDWHRLWIFLSVIYLLVVILIGYSEFPRPENISHKEEFYQKLSPESREMIHGRDTTKGGWEIVKEGGVTTDNLKSSKPKITAEEFLRSKEIFPTIEVEMPNGHIMKLRGGPSDEQMNQVAKEYADVLNQSVSGKRVPFVINAFLIWIIPCLWFYALGWAIKWIYRGFKSE